MRTPLAETNRPEDVGRAIAWLASAPADRVTGAIMDRGLSAP
jgi:NAD(P)-dependent dehydrogenase (short-subunit alcohol dehydrogenase family)